MTRRRRVTQTLLDQSYLEALMALQRLYEVSGGSGSTAREGKRASSVPSSGEPQKERVTM